MNSNNDEQQQQQQDDGDDASGKIYTDMQVHIPSLSNMCYNNPNTNNSNTK